MVKHIVIIGGGFGGVYTAKYLLKKLKCRNDFKITLINRENYFLFTPMLHEVATGGLNRSNIVEPIRQILKADNFEFIKCRVKEIDFNKKIVYTNLCDLNYDSLVIAIGSTSNFYNISGAKEYCLDLKDIQAAASVRNKIIDSLELALKLKNKEDISKYLTFCVVGGGPTGVELAAEISEFVKQMLKDNYKHLGKNNFKIYLIQKGDKIMPFIHPKCIEKASNELINKGVTLLLNSSVSKVFKDAVEINNNKKIYSNTIIWTSGIKPNEIKTIPKITDEKEYFHVNEFLQVDKMNNVFALGDCALFFNKNEDKPIPFLAQTAIKEAEYVTKNIINSIEGKNLEECRVRLSGLLVSIGQKYAVADIHGIRFKGFFAWWLWRTIYLFKLIGKANKFRVALDWTINLFSKRNTSEI